MSIFSRWMEKRRQDKEREKPALTGLPFEPVIMWACGTCRHALPDHVPLGFCQVLVSREAYNGQYCQAPCLCQVDPAALAAFLKADLFTRLAKAGYMKIGIRTEGVGGGKQS